MKELIRLVTREATRTQSFFILDIKFYFQKQPSGGVLRKRCSENIQQIYRRTPMPKCDFNRAEKQLY